MTLSNIRTQILNHFLTNDTFFHSDAVKIKTEKDLEKMKGGLVLQAMKDLEESKIVSKLTDAEGVERGWILESKLGSHGQEIYISLPVADAISGVINSYIQANGLKENLSNSLNITERDIIALLEIIENTIDEDPKK